MQNRCCILEMRANQYVVCNFLKCVKHVFVCFICFVVVVLLLLFCCCCLFCCFFVCFFQIILQNLQTRDTQCYCVVMALCNRNLPWIDETIQIRSKMECVRAMPQPYYRAYSAFTCTSIDIFACNISIFASFKITRFK